eukprot:SAG25_NODE_11881_length_292_cov_1.854922_1_plen_50_part_10
MRPRLPIPIGHHIANDLVSTTYRAGKIQRSSTVLNMDRNSTYTRGTNILV